MDTKPASVEASPETGRYEGRPRFFSILYHRVTLDHSAGLSDPIRELDLPETKVQLLGSRRIPERGVNVLFYRDRASNIAK